MSEKTEKKDIKPGDELVSYTAPLLPGMESQDIVVGVNGQFIRIVRGETVKIKRKFVEVLNNAVKQQTDAYKRSVQAQGSHKYMDM
jgi:hypothetical protein